MKIKTYPWNAADYLVTEEQMAEYLCAIIEEGVPSLVVTALGDIARAKGLNEIARQTGLSRAALNRALSADANPKSATVKKVVRALGSKPTISSTVSVELKTVTGIEWDAKRSKRKAL